jgi:AraC-like DNA-binding protein
MDVLSDVLRAIRLTGAVFFDMEAHSPWVGTTPASELIAGLVHPGAEHIICFHAVTAGSCWVGLADGSLPPMHLNAGDIVIIPWGDAHFLSSHPGMRGEPDIEAYREAASRRRPQPHVLNQTAGGVEACHFVCGYLSCDLRPFNPLLDALPSLFHARASTASQGWLAGVIQAAVTETEDESAGRETMLAKAAELLFIEVLRKHISGLPEDARGWLSGLRDRHVGVALQLIHDKPAQDWTLEALARAAGLSRSALAKRFNHYVGAPPIEYLGRWRMQVAGRLLDEGATIADAAARVGYESEVTFNRAFKRLVGIPPGAWRRGRSRQVQ